MQSPSSKFVKCSSGIVERMSQANALRSTEKMVGESMENFNTSLSMVKADE